MPILGVATLLWTAGTTSGHASFLVAESLVDEVILGTHLLNEQSAVIDYTRRCIHLGKKSRDTVYWSPQQPPAAATEPPTDIVLPTGHEEACRSLLTRFSAVFAPHGPPTSTRCHDIPLRDTKPFRHPSRHYSDKNTGIISDQVAEMLANGVVEPSRSEYSSPIVIVTKKSGEPRFCIDYRRLNDATRDEDVVIPNIPETLRGLGD